MFLYPCFFFLSIKLRLIIMSTNLEYRERGRQRKRESRATGQPSLTRTGARARGKKTKGDIFCWRNEMKFWSGGMLAATRVKMSDSEKRVNKNTSDIPSIKRVTMKFLEASRNSRANGKKMYKKVCCTCKVAFLIRPNCCFLPFYRSRCLRRLALYDSIFCLSKL